MLFGSCLIVEERVQEEPDNVLTGTSRRPSVPVPVPWDEVLLLNKQKRVMTKTCVLGR